MSSTGPDPTPGEPAVAPDPWRLPGARAVVTGGTRGIGAAIVAELVDRGATDVWIVARDAERLAAACRRLAERGVRAHPVAADVASPEGRARVVAAVGAEPLDVLVNNAGTNVRKPSLAYTGDEVDALLRANLLAAFELARGLHPALARSGRAAVVNVGSVAGQTSTGTGVVYAMAKAALVQMTAYLAVEWAPAGIRVNAVAPWYVRTPLVEDVLARPGVLDAVLARTPMRRIGTAREVATAVAFLCLPAAGWITGQCLAVDGGFTRAGFTPPG